VRLCQKIVIQKINITRQGPGEPSGSLPDSVICIVHYLDFKGSSSRNKDLVPVHFKRPSYYPAASTPKK